MNIVSRISLVLVVGLLFVGCETSSINKTFNKISGKPTYNSSSYGKNALFGVIENEKSSKADAIAASNELALRSMDKDDGKRLASALQNNISESVELAIISTIKKKNMKYLLVDLIRYFPKAKGENSAAEAAVVIATFMPNDDHLFAFMKKYAIVCEYPNVRARAARFLTNFPDKSTPYLVTALKTETSASAALAMCEALRDFGEEDGLRELERIQNDITRKFKTDSYLGSKVTSDMVRATAVNAVENSRR